VQWQTHLFRVSESKYFFRQEHRALQSNGSTSLGGTEKMLWKFVLFWRRIETCHLNIDRHKQKQTQKQTEKNKLTQTQKLWSMHENIRTYYCPRVFVLSYHRNRMKISPFTVLFRILTKILKQYSSSLRSSLIMFSRVVKNKANKIYWIKMSANNGWKQMCTHVSPEYL
jgi:hypothetical protein